jgi:hypothetical protein
VLSFLGMILFLLAAFDAVGSLFGWSLTALSWSPLIFLVLGFLLVTLEELERESKPS